MYRKGVFRNVPAISDNHDTNSIGIDYETCPAESLEEGSDVDLFFFETVDNEGNDFRFVTTPATNIS